ncbi:hypothetical protein RRG08_015909 [Elysia crispata]|uniref:Uncharacterized protein n=1 Tax=Elysia crispata TaxID=231223 RepID=A0AAE1E1S9_9GAST|nr:hypothetical protein RRG08_015909 [Elysia crispata]
MSKKTVYLLYLSSPKQKYGCLAYTDGSTVTLTYSSMAEIKKVLISLTTSLRLFVYLFKLSLMHIQLTLVTDFDLLLDNEEPPLPHNPGHTHWQPIVHNQCCTARRTKRFQHDHGHQGYRLTVSCSQVYRYSYPARYCLPDPAKATTRPQHTICRPRLCLDLQGTNPKVD